MYCSYFGFRFPPFRKLPHPETFFEGAQRGAILEALMYAIEHGDGVVQVTGAPGSGRTTMCRMLQARMAGRIPCAHLADPDLTPRQAMHAIAHGLGIGPTQTGADPGAGVQAFLREGMKSGRHAVVLVEEAQRMPAATLEAVRLLSTLAGDGRKALQLVLVGTPALDLVLARPELRQLGSRITHRAQLPPLSPQETADYLGHRLRAAGAAAPAMFPASVARYIGRTSGGLPRHIDRLADRTLMAAFAGDTRDISMTHAHKAADELGMAPSGLLAKLRGLLPTRRTAALQTNAVSR